MAEFILKKMVKDDNREKEFEIKSVATSREELGNDIYPPAKEELKRREIPFEKRKARQITIEDYNYFDVIYYMDENNYRNATRLLNLGEENKLKKFPIDHSVADPWYTGNFDRTYSDLFEGCLNIIKAFY